MCPTFHCNLTVQFTFNCLIKSNVEVTVKTVNQLYNYSTVLGAGIKFKPYSEITVEMGTHLKTVKITLNIFAVYRIKRVSRNSVVEFWEQGQGQLGQDFCSKTSSRKIFFFLTELRFKLKMFEFKNMLLISSNQSYTLQNSWHFQLTDRYLNFSFFSYSKFVCVKTSIVDGGTVSKQKKHTGIKVILKTFKEIIYIGTGIKNLMKYILGLTQ